MWVDIQQWHSPRLEATLATTSPIVLQCLVVFVVSQQVECQDGLPLSYIAITIDKLIATDCYQIPEARISKPVEPTVDRMRPFCLEVILAFTMSSFGPSL